MKMRWLTVSIFLTSVALLALLVSSGVWPTAAAPVRAATADAENVELVGHIGGVTEAVFVQGNYAYIGEGPGLTILDISNPASPTVVGKTPPLPDIVRGVYVSGSYAYVAVDEAGLQVVDVSNPRRPRRQSVPTIRGGKPTAWW